MIFFLSKECRSSKPLKEIQKCCHGYGRTRTLSASSIFEPCEEVNLISERLNSSEFVNAAKKNNVEKSIPHLPNSNK